MTLMLLTGPAEEPVTLDEMRIYLRIDGAEENELLRALITAARTMLEAETRRAFVTQKWRLILDEWPDQPITLPLAPAASVVSVKVAGANDEMILLDPTLYEVDEAGEPPRIAAKRGRAWPVPTTRLAGIIIDFDAGYGASENVPAPLKQAIVMLVAHWYENRDPIADGEELPRTVSALVAQYKRRRL